MLCSASALQVVQGHGLCSLAGVFGVLIVVNSMGNADCGSSVPANTVFPSLEKWCSKGWAGEVPVLERLCSPRDVWTHLSGMTLTEILTI